MTWRSVTYVAGAMWGLRVRASNTQRSPLCLFAVVMNVTVTPRSSSTGEVVMGRGSEKTPRPLPSAVTVKVHVVPDWYTALAK